MQERFRPDRITEYADMFAAMGTESRLRIMQLLLSAHPEGMVVQEIQAELGIPNSTLSHHLDKLRNEGLIKVQRESTFLRYSANTEVLRELLQWLERAALRAGRSRRESRKNSVSAVYHSPTELEDAPHCPSCNRSMVKRKARRAAHARSEFWGCPNFPECRGTREI